MKSCKSCSFSDKVRWRIRGLWCLLILMLVYMVVTTELGWGDRRMMTDLAEVFGNLSFFGGLAWVGWKIRWNGRLLNNPWKLKEQAVLEKDERNRYLRDKSGGIVWDILFVCLLFVAQVAAGFHMMVFYAVFALLCIAVVLKVAVWLYYSRKI